MSEPIQLKPVAGDEHLKWYQGLDRYCWVVLIIAALGWLFDTMDQNLFTMVRRPSLMAILRPQYPNPADLEVAVKNAGGLITTLFILGWATGGFLFGMLGDKLGRTKTMILTILTYALFTGLSGLANSVWFYAVARFLTGMGVGGEWAAGAALVAETFPSRSRPMALALLQALSTIGNIMAAVITFIIGDLETGKLSLFGQNWEGWRVAFFIGAVPALLVLWIRSSVREPEAWVKQKMSNAEGKKLGRISELFTNPILRKHTIVACLMATAGVGALWGAAFFGVDLVMKELGSTGMGGAEKGRYASVMFIAMQVGAFFGIYLFGMAAQRFGRRPSFIVWFALSWASILIFFWCVQGSGTSARWLAPTLGAFMGFAALGPFSGYSIYFPELFPTRLRATGCGFCYNAARYLAAGAPFALGGLAGSLGYAKAASIVSCVLILGFIGTLLGPETKGQPLPDHL